MKSIIVLIALLIAIQTWAQQRVNVVYEGGNFTHPGLSVGYMSTLKNYRQWSVQAGGKVGFYAHRRYHSAFFVLPQIGWEHIGKKEWIWRADILFGVQRTFVPHTYEVHNDGSISRERFSGIMQAVIAPGFSFGRKLSLKRNLPINWFVNPQLQFRMPSTADLKNTY